MTEQDLYGTLIGYLVMGGVGLVTLTILFLLNPSLRRHLLPLPHLRPGSWTGADVVLCFLMSQVAGLILLSATRKLMLDLDLFQMLYADKLDDRQMAAHALFLVGPAIFVLTLGLLLGFLRGRSGSRPQQLGLSTARWRANLVVGILAFLVLTPLTQAVFYLSGLIFPHVGHYPQETLNIVTLGWEWGFVLFFTCVGTPVIEELLFRGILLGWLRRASLRGHVALMGIILLTGSSVSAVQEDQAWQEQPFYFALALVAVYAGLVWWLSRRFLPAGLDARLWNLQEYGPDRRAPEGDVSIASAETSHVPIPDRREWERWQRVNGYLAVYGSAAFFGIAHATVMWPAPVPLFVLGLGLGWLALRTQNLLPSILVHGLFNAVTCVALYLAAKEGGTNGNAVTEAQRPALVGSVNSSVPTAWQPRRR